MTTNLRGYTFVHATVEIGAPITRKLFLQMHKMLGLVVPSELHGRPLKQLVYAASFTLTLPRTWSKCDKFLSYLRGRGIRHSTGIKYEWEPPTRRAKPLRRSRAPKRVGVKN